MRSLNDSLAVFWKLNESTGTRVDFKENDDLTDNGGVGQADGVNAETTDKAADFIESSSTFLQKTSPTNELTLGDTDWTWAFWVKFDSFNAVENLVVKWDDDLANGLEYLIRYNGSAFDFFVSADGDPSPFNGTSVAATSFGAASTDTWYFVVAWHDSVNNNINIQINNGTVDTTSWSNGVFNTDNSNFQLGHREDTVTLIYLDGKMDAVGLWNRVLTADEKTSLYNAGKGLEPPFLDTVPLAKVGGYSLGVGSSTSGFIGGWTEGDPHTGPQDLIGGLLLAKSAPENNIFGIFGGWVESPETTVKASMGAILWALPLTDVGPAFVGAISSGTLLKEEFVGGWVFGRPRELQHIETHSRSLMKARSESVTSQALNLDAQIRFVGKDDKDFNAKLQVNKTFSSDFNAKLIVDKNLRKNDVFITNISVEPSGIIGPSGSTVTITASGELKDANFWNSAQIDFGEPVVANAQTKFLSVSGIQGNPPWTASYTYNTSGIYYVTVRAVDDIGTVDMDYTEINLASGLVPGVDYPVISISGTPRVGFVPPSLRVDFNTQISGGSLKSPTDQNLFWSFGNNQRSRRVTPTTFYRSPGCFVPVARYRHLKTNPSGDQSYIWTGDTLKVGFEI